MILTDTGPLVAVLVPADLNHFDCVSALAGFGKDILLTTWPCLTEAMYLLGRAGGHSAQDRLWEWVSRGILVIRPPAADEWLRMRVLMARYANLPMDLADASLVVSAERAGIHRIFTTDGDFRVYLINDRGPFDVVP